MKKILCFLGILVLLFLTVLPPALRIFLKDKDETPIVQETKTLILFCTGTDFMTNTNYENDTIKRIVIKKIITSQEGETSEENTPQENSPSLELDTLFTNLKNSGVLTVNTLEDGETIDIDLEFLNAKKIDVVKITQKIDEQKIYYENNGLTCTIRE